MARHAEPARTDDPHAPSIEANDHGAAQNEHALAPAGVPGPPAPSWAPPLRVTQQQLDVRCPGGHRATRYATCLHELYAVHGDSSRWDGLIDKRTRYVVCLSCVKVAKPGAVSHLTRMHQRTRWRSCGNGFSGAWIASSTERPCPVSTTPWSALGPGPCTPWSSWCKRPPDATSAASLHGAALVPSVFVFDHGLTTGVPMAWCAGSIAR